MENDLNSVVDSLPGLVWTAQPDGQVDFFNLHWRAYTGLDVDEACGSGWQLAIHPADRPACSTAGNPSWRPVNPAGWKRACGASMESIAGSSFARRPASAHPGRSSTGVEQAPTSMTSGDLP